MGSVNPLRLSLGIMAKVTVGKKSERESLKKRSLLPDEQKS